MSGVSAIERSTLGILHYQNKLELEETEIEIEIEIEIKILKKTKQLTDHHYRSGADAGLT